MKDLKSIVFNLNIFLTTMISSIMIYYCIVLGRYFNFLLANNLLEGFTEYYSPFRNSSNATIIMNSILIIQLIVAATSLIINYRTRALFGQFIALAAPLLLIILHLLSGFAMAEGAITAASDLTESQINKFLWLNLPLHIIYSVAYGLGALLLIFQKGKE